MHKNFPIPNEKKDSFLCGERRGGGRIIYSLVIDTQITKSLIATLVESDFKVNK